MSTPWQHPGPHGPQQHPYEQRPYEQHPSVAGRPAPAPHPLFTSAAWAPAPAVQPSTAVHDAHRTPSRTPWVPLVGTATAAAVAASLLTAGATGAFDAEPAGTGAVSQETTPQSLPASYSGEQPDWQAVADAVRASVVAIQVRTAQGAGQGSGVVIDDEGRILTNDHVVGDAVDGGLQVGLADGRLFEAALVGADPTRDLAVIQLVDPPADLEPAELGDSEAVAVGAPVMAVGNPLGLDSTVTTGIVSALDRPVTTGDGAGSAVVTNAIQIDAAINPGNSGGPLFDAQGRVIGINSSIASMPNGSGGSSGSIGLGFAIPSSLAERVAAELVEAGAASHAFLGVALSDGTAEVDGASRRGAVVEEVTDGTPAAEAGLRAGDVVVAIDGDPVRGAESLTAFVRERAVGEEVELAVARDGRTGTVPVTLVERPDVAQPQRPEGLPRGFDPGDLPDLFGQG